MLTLLRKEIAAFLSSLIGYIVIGVFLITISLFMWVFPGSYNVMDSGYANIDTLFIIAPWVFMFLAPAVTMRSFAEEQRTGTIELLITKPLSDLQIILSKFLAGFLLVIFSLLPTLIYYFSIYELGSTTGNIDTGAVIGSYIGLLFLAGCFVAIGIFASSLSQNQIISFIIAMFLSFFCYVGFEQIASFDLMGSFDSVIMNLGINEHYISISRGVIDSRDIIYFLSLIAVFIMLTKLRLESRKW
ncbi:gliding motility-associated ABC transporter permease subunit GldF [Salibacter sp.]|uniref:gliding motility-associated ABC transporter permease subunit GldF n=1 Tax=Salibacter sp. TaxID=2010995 RepID=UPI00287082CB|nr:gliding motility-associated ABC transporter permease subunit GldF [Salibacter sp.]MDR9487901.1 gliding motility-associated ABC transporter permease subunit GldF [Salibacter sp.]